jgi:putative oxidoreductase
MTETLSRIRILILNVAAQLSWLPPLLARLTLGIVFVQSGWGKLHNLPKVIDFFTSLGIPAPWFQAHLVASTELVCGGLVLIGLLTRLASIPLAITMVVALITAKLSDIHELSDLFSTSEYLYILLFIWLAIQGAGKVSIDAVLARRFFGRPSRAA